MRTHKNRLIFWLFLLPALFFFINVVILPFIMGIVYSFTDWGGFSLQGAKFTGIKNYIRAFGDEAFTQSLLFTFKYAAARVAAVILIGFSLALLVTRPFRSRNVLRTVFFMPHLIGGLILGFIWQFIFSKLWVQLGELLHASTLFFNWLNDPQTAFWSLVIVGTWQMAGYVMVIYIAGIQSIPNELLEAAQIDGASLLQRLLHIMLPLTMPSFTICLFLTLSNSLKLLDTNLSLTNGGPYGTTQTVALNIYQTAYARQEFVLAQAKAVVFFVVVVIITLFQVHLTSRKEVEM